MHTLFVVLTRAWPHRNDIGSIQNFEREVESIWNSFYTFISIQKTWFILAFLYFYLYMYVIVQWSVLCRFDPYVLYLEYSTFSDKLFSRALYRLSLTDQMDCKSQKGRIRIGNITRNRNDEQHNCLLNNQKYVIDTRLFKCIN